MKIFHTADIHANESQLAWLNKKLRQDHYDIFVIAGDLLSLRSGEPFVAQISRIKDFLQGLPKELTIIICTGNHDIDSGFDEIRNDDWLRSIRLPNIFLPGETTTLNGLVFESLAWTEQPSSMSDEKAHFIVSHWPAAQTPTSVNSKDNLEKGDPEIKEYLSVNGGIQLCGHVHHALNWNFHKEPFYDLRPGFQILNPCNSGRFSIPNFILIDTDKKTAIHYKQEEAKEKILLKL